MAQTIHFIRHGEVQNPEKILYGLQPGWHLSDRGRQMAEVVAKWSEPLNLGVNGSLCTESIGATVSWARSSGDEKITPRFSGSDHFATTSAI